MLTNEQIDARIEELAEGDSNDAEIDSLLEIVRDLQTERKNRFSISFAGEAYETFQKVLQGMHGYGVTITTQNGETFDAVLVGPDLQDEWGDTVLSHEVKDGEDYLVVDAYTTPPRSDRITDVQVH